MVMSAIPRPISQKQKSNWDLKFDIRLRTEFRKRSNGMVRAKISATHLLESKSGMRKWTARSAQPATLQSEKNDDSRNTEQHTGTRLGDRRQREMIEVIPPVKDLINLRRVYRGGIGRRQCAR